VKVGDLVTMIDETIPPGESPSVGLIVEDDIRFPGGNTRIGVLWFDSDCVDFEPKDWLEVLK
jgi:hypothetical protein